jgi:hypothetical protein
MMDRLQHFMLVSASVLLIVGDTYVLRGANHRWKIPEGKKVKWFTVLVDAKPFEIPGSGVVVKDDLVMVEDNGVNLNQL